MVLLLATDIWDETMFQEVKTYLEKNQLSLTNVIRCATDGAWSVIGCYHGFIALLKAAIFTCSRFTV